MAIAYTVFCLLFWGRSWKNNVIQVLYHWRPNLERNSSCKETLSEFRAVTS